MQYGIIVTADDFRNGCARTGIVSVTIQQRITTAIAIILSSRIIRPWNNTARGLCAHLIDIDHFITAITRRYRRAGNANYRASQPSRAQDLQYTRAARAFRPFVIRGDFRSRSLSVSAEFLYRGARAQCRETFLLFAENNRHILLQQRLRPDFADGILRVCRGRRKTRFLGFV